jgi:putative transport protein
MLSGALTESPAMGTATEAIQALPLDASTKELYAAHVGVADALCYLMGALGVILTCTLIGPKLLRVDLAAHALDVEAKYGIKRQAQGIRAAWQPFETRAYRVAEGARIAGLTVDAAERLIDGTRLFVHRIRRDGKIFDAKEDMTILAGDHIAAGGRREALVDIVGPRGDEVDDASLLDIPIASHEIFVSEPRWAGHTLGEIAAHDDFDAVFVRRIQRGGQEMPIGTQTTVERGDVLLLIGPERRVECAADALGQIIRPTDATDFTVVGFAIFVGGLLGIVAAVKVAGIQIGLGTSIGVLLAGLATGHVRGRRPLFGRVPDAAVKLMQSFGLAAFVAMVGLGAGPHFLPAMRESGIGLFFGGVVVTFAPLLFGLWFGRKVLGIDPLLLLGAISGAQTFTPGLAAVQEKSGSPVAVIGYSGAVAVAHVLLTTWGTVMVLVMR